MDGPWSGPVVVAVLRRPPPPSPREAKQADSTHAQQGEGGGFGNAGHCQVVDKHGRIADSFEHQSKLLCRRRVDPQRREIERPIVHGIIPG